MGGVTIEELGLGFVWECLKQYWGGCLFLVLFLAGIVWSILRHRRQEPMIFPGMALFLLLTVYNPFIVKYVVSKINFENEYYRFFWLLPVVIGVAYYGVRLVFLAKKRWLRFLLALAVCGIIVFTGTPLEGVATNFALTDNLYKVPDDLRAACVVIHEDSEKENPRVVFSVALNSLARQYDPSLFLVLNRNYVLYRTGSTVMGTVDEENASYRRQKVIMDVAYYEMEDPLFHKALVRTKTDYLVLPVTLTNHEFIREAGCEPIAQTENYVVYHFDWESA